MAPTSSKANYKTYEAQARLLRAVVAAHPEVKWNYKAIAACYGSDMSEHALNHRFRKIRAQSLVIKLGRERGFDMRDLCVDENKLPSTQERVDQKNIAKYFGQSTADGIQFQFRAYKKDAETLRAVHSAGGDVANCLPLSTLTTTPSKPTPSRSTNTPVSRRSGATITPSTARKRPRIKRSDSDDERDDDGDGDGDGDGDDDMMDDEHDEQDPSDQHDDWSDRDRDLEAVTPSRRPAKHPRSSTKSRAPTPRRHAAAKASATIAQLGHDSSDDTTAPAPAPVRAYKSLFADPDVQEVDLSVSVFDDPAVGPAHGGLTTFDPDPFMETTMQRGTYGDDGYGDGEI
ncbi:hypothetical protein E4U54_007627 [Claviceps lovelessii]|nr:hypothetical protein E4U54_007627 [Claviceps lovelessii]